MNSRLGTSRPRGCLCGWEAWDIVGLPGDSERGMDKMNRSRGAVRWATLAGPTPGR